jgi:uncharacterized cupredoxin-like copper-binding protein
VTEPVPYSAPTSDAGGDTPAAPGRAPGTPRWVKALAIGGLIVVVLVVVVMLVAGGQHGPGMHMPGGDSPGGQTQMASIPQVPTPSSGQDTTRELGGPATAGEAARTVEVSTLDSMAFDPSTIEVSAGETVTFVVTNAGQAVHEFTLGDAAMQLQHAAQMAHMPEGMAHGQPNSITLQPGETKELTWRFGATGMLEYACHERGHYEAGVRGRLTVS